MKLREFLNEQTHPIIWYTSTGCPMGNCEIEIFGVDSIVDQRELGDLEGTVDDGAWHWNGEGNPKDHSFNSIMRIEVWNDPARWQRMHDDYMADV